MIILLIAQIIINSYQLGALPVPSGETGNILQEDGTFLFQQDGSSKILKEFTAGGSLLQQDGFFLFQQDGASKIKKEE